MLVSQTSSFPNTGGEKFSLCLSWELLLWQEEMTVGSISFTDYLFITFISHLSFIKILKTAHRKKFPGLLARPCSNPDRPIDHTLHIHHLCARRTKFKLAQSEEICNSGVLRETALCTLYLSWRLFSTWLSMVLLLCNPGITVLSSLFKDAIKLPIIITISRQALGKIRGEDSKGSFF